MLQPSLDDAAYAELVAARFAWESLRGETACIGQLGRASQRLLRARQAMGSPRVHSPRVHSPR